MKIHFNNPQFPKARSGVIPGCFIFVISILLLIAPVIGDDNLPASSPDGNWSVEQYRDGTGVLISPLPDASISAEFSGENLSGKAGCNMYTTQFTAAGGGMIILNPTVTEMFCSDPVMTQEDDYFHDLKEISLFQVNGSQLLLYDDDEELLISFTQQN